MEIIWVLFFISLFVGPVYFFNSQHRWNPSLEANQMHKAVEHLLPYMQGSEWADALGKLLWLVYTALPRLRQEQKGVERTHLHIHAGAHLHGIRPQLCDEQAGEIVRLVHFLQEETRGASGFRDPLAVRKHIDQTHSRHSGHLRK